MTTAPVVTTDGASATPGAAPLPARLLERATARPKAVALRRKELGRWREISWAEYARRVARVGLALRAVGVGAGDRVAILCDNRPEWLFVDLGAQGVGAVTVGVYPTSPEAEVQHVLAHSGAKVVVVEDEEQLDKVLAIRTLVPSLERVAVVDTRGIRRMPETAMSLEELETRGEQREREAPSEWTTAARALQPGDIATIVYTSGTTGLARGARITHASLAAAGELTAAAYGARDADDVLSYLPLSHVAERVVSLAAALSAGYVVNFGEGGDAFLNDLREVQPTLFLGVPRVWERMLGVVHVRSADAGRVKRAVLRNAQRGGVRSTAARQRGQGGFGHRARRLLVYRPLRRKLGLGRVRVALSGAAPISPAVLEQLWAIDLPVREAYGLTESTALGTTMPADAVRSGTVGVAIGGTEVRVADGGEVLLKGVGVFAGYLDDASATAEAFTADGWLRTGDLGTLDADGYLTITGRTKDVIVTSGGKNVSPQAIENRCKVSPYIREAVVIGDARPYLTALIGIELETVGEWAAHQNLAFTTYEDLVEKDEVRRLVAGVIEEVNRELADTERIRRFELLPNELDHEGGQLTATQKVRRQAIVGQHSELVEAMYEEDGR